ncbi:GNAT family N-acetyltransferase [Modestobacter sp. URMC 112]
MPHLTSAGWDDPVVRQLTAAQQAELRGRYGPDSEPGVPPSATDVAVVLVAVDDDGTPVGCGALRALGPDSAEVKRMYVVPAARRRGLARLLLEGLESVAVERGWTTLFLELGPGQPEAVGLYTGAGYTRTGAFGHYVRPDQDWSLYFRRRLAVREGR